MLLDRALPEYQFHEVHSTALRAQGDAVFDAIRAISPEELPLFRLLVAARSLPALVARRPGAWRPGGGSLLDRALRAGFVILGEEPDREIVLGMVAQPWRVLGARVTAAPATVETFAQFRKPGYAKMATNFLLDVHPSGLEPNRLRTETRVWLPDVATIVRFGAYWTLIRPGSGLIRREWLERIKVRAEQNG